MTRYRRMAMVLALGALSVSPALGGAGSPVLDAARRPNIRVREGTSTNWSGYAAFGGAGKFWSVAGSWTQPAVDCSVNGYSSYWVGLDGYNTNTVEQLGTEGDCVNGAAQYYAWLEMYPHGGTLIGVTVTPGDTYSAAVSALGHGVFSLALKDTKTGQSYSTQQRLNSAQEASAEVILEAPYKGGILPLAKFGTANFTGATADGHAIGTFAPNLDPITMLNPHGMKATPSPLDTATHENFSVTWSAS